MPDTANDATWNYKSTNLTGAGTVTLTGHCAGLRIINNSDSVNAEFTVNSGDTILVKAGREVYLNPNKKLKNPIITWVSGSMNVFIEVIR